MDRGLEKQSCAEEWEERGAHTQRGEGAGERVRHPKLRGGWSAPACPDWVFFNANSMLFTFHLNLRCCYKLSTSSLFLRSL